MRMLIIIIGILIALTTFISHAQSDNCHYKCLDFINLEECIQEEMEYWDHEVSRQEAMRECRFLVKQERIYCLIENCNYPKQKTNEED